MKKKSILFTSSLIFAASLSAQLNIDTNSTKVGDWFRTQLVEGNIAEEEQQFVQVLVRSEVSIQAVLQDLSWVLSEVLVVIPEDQYFEAKVKGEDLSVLIQHPGVLKADLISTFDFDEAIHDRAAAVRSNWLNSSVTGIMLDGTGVSIGIRESGSIDDNDIDLAFRQKNGFQSGAEAPHKTGVANHMASAGNKNPLTKAIVPGADIYDLPITSLNFNSLYTDQQIRYHNRSSGLTIGSAIYTIDSKNRDQNVYNNPEMLFIYSAGNSNGSSANYNYGPYSSLAGDQFATITSDEKSAKNNIVCQSVDEYDQGYGPGSRGPLYDGRLKPDLTSDGALGTSHAAPKITGVTALLGQAYYQKHGVYPPSSLLKAILFTTADDHGRPGPDYRYGYGKMNARRAYKVLDQSLFWNDTITAGAIDSFSVQLPVSNGVEFKATLVWTDPAADVSTTPDTALVNDLDFYLIVDDSLVRPWVLSTFPHEDSLRLDAVRGEDHLNNAEQITFTIPSQLAGKTVKLFVKGNRFKHPGITQQHYSLAYEIVRTGLVLTTPLGEEKWKPGDEQIIRWDAYGTASNFKIQVKDVSVGTWYDLATVGADQRHYVWNIPNTGDFYFKRLQVRIFTPADTLADSSQAFTVAPVPNGFKYLYTCSGDNFFTWEKMDSAGVKYRIHYLDQKYMSAGSTLFTDSVGHEVIGKYYYAVSAELNGIEGRRCLAEFAAEDSISCLITHAERNPSASIAILPNPADNFLSIEGTSSGPMRISLTNLEGKEIKEEVGVQLPFVWNIASLPSGVYLLQLTDQEGTVRSEKVVKQ